MNIAIVGGGTQCRRLLELIEKHRFVELSPRVVALADTRGDMFCVSMAKARNIFVTRDYNDLFERNDIDLIIELTGDEEVFYDILRKKRKTVRAFDHRTAQLFWEVSRVSDIEERTRQELCKTRATYHAVLNELTQEDVMVINPRYVIEDVNESVAHKQGLARQEIVGRYCYEISHHQQVPCHGELHPCPLQDTLATGKPSRTTHTHMDKDNNERLYSISCYPIVEQGETVAVIEIAKDITKDFDFQKAMMQNEKLASIGRLAAGVAHEINNPMTTILTTAMLLQEDLDPGSPIYQELQVITDETLRCRGIVTGLLGFARQAQPTRREHDLNDIVRETIALTRKQAGFKDVGMESELSNELPRVYVDKDQIQQSLINLTLNAIDATDSNGKVTFLTRWAPEDRMIELQVKDTGEGIPRNDLNKIFEPFFTTKEGGTGLGMAITHGFIKRHGGTISVASELGAGTVVTIRLPVAGGNDHVE